MSGGLTLYKTRNHGEEKLSWIAYNGEYYAHGSTAKEAAEDLALKITNRDTTPYEGLDLDTVKTPIEWAKCYRVVTGACSEGIRHYLNQKDLKEEYTLAEVIEGTKGAYGHKQFEAFF